MQYPRYLYRKQIALSLLNPYFAKLNNFLEIGFGRGAFLKVLSNYISNGTGIDFVNKEIEDNDSEKEYNVINGDFMSYRFEKTFDLIVMLEVLEHIKEDMLALNKINNLLSDKGIFLISVPAKMSKWSYVDENVGHYRRYEKKEFLKQLADNNFEIIKFVSYGFPILDIITTLTKGVYQKANETDTKEDLSKQSGQGYCEKKIFSNHVINGLIKIMFSDIMVKFYIFIFSPLNQSGFNNNYICLAKKK